MLGGARARCAIEKAPQCEYWAARARVVGPGRSRKLAILAPADRRRHDERRARQHVGGGTGVDLEQLHDPAYWPTGLLAYMYWPTGWWSGLCARK